MKKWHVSLQWKFLCCIVLIIFSTLGIIFTWAAIQNEKQAVDQAWSVTSDTGKPPTPFAVG